MATARRYAQRSLVAAWLLAVATASVAPAGGRSDSTPTGAGDTGGTELGSAAQLLRSSDRIRPVAVKGPVLPPPASTSAPILAPVPTTLTVAGIPARALAAYRAATARMASEDPGCRLPWPLVAAIGYVESDHGAVHGGSVDAEGRVSPPVLGPRLDGSGAFALIRDSDDGALDGDTALDRAVGPMQFIPSTWARSGADGDGDGRRDPHDLDDAALAAGRYLCSGGGRVDRPAGTIAAVFRYNHSYDYVRVVLTVAARYAGQSPQKWGVGLVPAASPTGSPSPSPSPSAVSPSPSPKPVRAASTPTATASPKAPPGGASASPAPSPSSSSLPGALDPILPEESAAPPPSPTPSP